MSTDLTPVRSAANAAVPLSPADFAAVLGGIPEHRVHRSPPPGTADSGDWEAAFRRGEVCELVEGTLVGKDMGFYESIIAGYLIRRFSEASGDGRLGLTSGEQGFIELPGGQILAPDVAFYLWSSLPEGFNRRHKRPRIRPDIAVEVLSEDNTIAEMDRKRRELFDAGTSIVWMVDPTARTVAVYRTVGDIEVCDTDAIVDGGGILPDLKVSIADMFSEIHGGRRDG